MDSFQYRKSARVVAYIDLILTGLSICGLAVLFVGAIVATSNITNTDQDQALAIIIIMFVVILVGFLVALVNMWAAVMLLKATNEGVDPAFALRKAQIWRNISAVFFFLAIISIPTGGTNAIAGLIQVIIRGIMIYFVTKFVQELDAHLKSGGATAPTYA